MKSLRGTAPPAHTGQTPAETAKPLLAKALPQSLASLAVGIFTRIPLIDILNLSKSSRIRSPRKNREAKKMPFSDPCQNWILLAPAIIALGECISSFLAFEHAKDGHTFKLRNELTHKTFHFVYAKPSNMVLADHVANVASLMT